MDISPLYKPFVTNLLNCDVFCRVKLWLACTDLVLIAEVKYQYVAVDEPQLASALPSLHSGENEHGNREQAIDMLPDIVRDVEEYLACDASFVRESSPDTGKDVEATWSKEVLSSAGSREDELASTERRNYWNSNDKAAGDEMIVTINLTYNKESDASSRSSLDDHFEVLSSIGDACSKAQSSVAEAIDLSDTEQPLTTGDETAGRFESADKNAEQVMTELDCNLVNTQVTGKFTETQEDMLRMEYQETAAELDRAVDADSGKEMLDNADVTVRGQLVDGIGSRLAQNVTSHQAENSENRKTAEETNIEISEHTHVPPAEPLSERSYTTEHVVADVEALEELDAYLSSVVVADDHRGLDGDNLHMRTANFAASEDDDNDVLEKGLSSKDDKDIVYVVGSTAGTNDVEQRDEVDVDQPEHRSVKVPASCTVPNLYADADVGIQHSNVNQLGNNEVQTTGTQQCIVGNASVFLGNKTTEVRLCKRQDFNGVPDSDKAAEVNEVTAAKDLDEVADEPDLVQNTSCKSPTQFADITFCVSTDKTYSDALMSDCPSELLTTELVEDDVKMADAEVDAIFSCAVGGMLDDQDSCRIRHISGDEADAVVRGETDLCVQFSQTSDTPHTDDFVACGVTASYPVTHEEQQLTTEETPEPDKSDVPDSNESDTSNAIRMSLPHVCISEASDIKDQFERDRTADVARVAEDQDTQTEPVSVSHLLHRQPEINNLVNECDAESDQTSSDLETSLPVEPSCMIPDVWNEDDSESANSEVDTKSKAFEESQEGDHAATTANVNSPGSNVSWRSCTTAVSEPEKNTEYHTKLESVPNLRGVTISQITAYRMFRKDRPNIIPVHFSDDMGNTAAHNESEDEDDENASFPYVDAIGVSPFRNLDSKAHHGLPECDLSNFNEGCFGMESYIPQNKHIEAKTKKNEISTEESFPAVKDLDEIGECSLDAADSCVTEVDNDVTLTNFASECSKTFTTYVGTIQPSFSNKVIYNNVL